MTHNDAKDDAKAWPQTRGNLSRDKHLGNCDAVRDDAKRCNPTSMDAVAEAGRDWSGPEFGGRFLFDGYLMEARSKRNCLNFGML